MSIIREEIKMLHTSLPMKAHRETWNRMAIDNDPKKKEATFFNMSELIYKLKMSSKVSLDPYDCNLPQLKKYARQGFTVQHRGRGWMRGVGIELTDSYLKKSKAFYVHGLHSVFHEGDLSYINVDIAQIPTFGSRMKWLQDGSLATEQVNSCGRILCVLRELADVRYGPIIPQIVSLLVPQLEEHEAFAVITSMCKRKGSEYFSVTELGATTQIEAFKDMVSDLLDKKLAEHINSLSRFLTFDMYNDWFNYMFVGWLKADDVLRIMDAFTVEGLKILYRFALGILKHFSDLILLATSEEDMLSSLRKALQADNFNFDNLCLTSYAKVVLKRSSIYDYIERASVYIENKNCAVVSSGVPIAVSGVTGGSRLPKIEGNQPKLLNIANLRSLLPHLPSRLQQKDVQLAFSSITHGRDLSTLYEKSAAHGPNILLLQTKEGKIIGCFASHAWRLHKKFYGNEHCCIFESHSDLKLANPGDFHVFDSVELHDVQLSGKPILDEDEQWASLPDDLFKDISRVEFQSGSIGIIWETDVHGYGAVVKSIVPDGQAEKYNNKTSGRKVIPGDVLISINEIKMVGIEHSQATEIIKKSSGMAVRSLGFVSNKIFYATLARGMPSSSLEGTSGQQIILPELLLDGEEIKNGEGKEEEAKRTFESDDESDSDCESPGSGSDLATPRTATPVRRNSSFDVVGFTPYWKTMSPASLTSHAQHVYMMTRADFLVMGGSKGQSNAAIKLYADLSRGSSEETETFKNYPLHGKEFANKYFEISLVELYVFVTPVSSSYALSWHTPSLKPTKMPKSPSVSGPKKSFDKRPSFAPRTSFDLDRAK